MTGAVIVLSGPDGTGKSSVADRLEEWSPSGSLRIHHRPRVLPSPGGRGDPTNPHALQPRGPGLSAVKIVYVFMDYVFGWLLRVFPAKRRGMTVIIERGWCDMIADPVRYRLRGVERVALFLGSWLPRPDLHVILEAPPQLLLARKSEISEDELSRQMERWRELGTKRGAVHIDCSVPLDEVVRDILKELTDRTTSA